MCLFVFLILRPHLTVFRGLLEFLRSEVIPDSAQGTIYSSGGLHLGSMAKVILCKANGLLSCVFLQATRDSLNGHKVTMNHGEVIL